MAGWVMASEASYCLGEAGAGAAVAGVSYICRERETLGYWSNIDRDGRQLPGGWGADVADLIAGWRSIVTREVKRRRTARHTQRMIVPLPNDLTADQQRQFVVRWVKACGLVDHPCIVSLHRGEAGACKKNLHLHLITNQRRFSGRCAGAMCKRGWLRATRDAAGRELSALGIEIEHFAVRRDRLARAGRVHRRKVHRKRYVTARADEARRARIGQRLALRARERELRREGATLQRECRALVKKSWPRIHAAVPPSPALARDEWTRLRKLETSESMVDRAIAVGELAAREDNTQRRRFLRLACEVAAAAGRANWIAAYEAARPLVVWLDQWQQRQQQGQQPARISAPTISR